MSRNHINKPQQSLIFILDNAYFSANLTHAGAFAKRFFLLTSAG